MNNNSMISVMFEEIKSRIALIDKKIDERISAQGSSLANTPSQNPNEEQEPSPLEKSIRQIPLHLTGIQKRLNQISEAGRESEKHFLSHIEDLKQRIDNFKTDKSIRHYHVVDLKSSKVVVSLIVLSLMLSGSFIENIYQIREINRMNDNDIKYRYIKISNGISPENLNKLENIVNYNRDKKVINEIRKEVEDFERRVRERGAAIERDRSKESGSKN